MNNLDPTSLENNWTAEVRLNNNQIIEIWWTAWYGLHKSVKEIISISSDYPRAQIKNSIYLS